MEEENKSEKNKRRIVLLFGIVAILVALSGATFAYFQITTETSNSKATITGSTPASGLVTLNQGVDNLHLNISASDMSLNNKGKEYYGTDDDQNYVDTEVLGTKTIADVTLSGGEETTKYSCTAKLTVSKDETDTMIEVLQPGDMILQFKGNIISEKLDLSDLKDNNPKEYNLSFKITGNNKEEIQAYIKLLNKEEQQNYLAGRKLNIDITTSELKCEVALPDPKIAQLREKDPSNTLSEDLQGGMYRYQGTDNVPNWICFGTRNADECKSDPDGIDKYMYRIIGITEEGQMYLIKETFLKEGSGTTFTWNDKYSVDSSSSYYCDNGLCPEWNTSLLFKRINGTSNGTTQGTTSNKADTDIFVDSAQYDYLKSGDSNSGGSASEWYNLIANHEWLYGDTNESSAANKYNGDAMYAIENGDKETTHYVGTKDNITQEPYTWSQKVTAKISLMYLHDYYYGYYDGSSEESRGNAGSYSKLASSWLFFKKDGYNSSQSSEWLSTRWGVYSTSLANVYAWFVNNNGDWGYDDLSLAYGVRPVFYLESSAKISSGDGTKENPFILA